MESLTRFLAHEARMSPTPVVLVISSLAEGLNPKMTNRRLPLVLGHAQPSEHGGASAR